MAVSHSSPSVCPHVHYPGHSCAMPVGKPCYPDDFDHQIGSEAWHDINT